MEKYPGGLQDPPPQFFFSYFRFWLKQKWWAGFEGVAEVRKGWRGLDKIEQNLTRAKRLSKLLYNQIQTGWKLDKNWIKTCLKLKKRKLFV